MKLRRFDPMRFQRSKPMPKFPRQDDPASHPISAQRKFRLGVEGRLTAPVPSGSALVGESTTAAALPKEPEI